MKAEGRVFKYGDNVDTDVIIPARYLNSSDPAELATHCMEDIDKEFVNKVQKGDIIVANVGGEFTVKRLVITALGIELHPENSSGQYSIIRPTDGVEITLVGVLTHSIKRFRKA